MKFEEVDKNFKIETNIEREGLTFINALEEPFKIYGLEHSEGLFRRMPQAIAETVSPNTVHLHTHTTGGRVRFRTNSPYVAIKAVMPYVYRASHMAMVGSSGFDIYVDGAYHKSFIPPLNMQNGYESVSDLDGEMHEITITFPIYSRVSDLYIGLKGEAEIFNPTPYKYEVPVVFYGASITQGGCASRPSRSFPAIVSRHLDCNFINLGFSGSARGEESMARYIANLDMSAYVHDLDTGNLQLHERFFEIIREKHPDLPIVVLAFPCYNNKRRDPGNEKLRKMCQDIHDRGDENIYFIGSQELTNLCKGEGTVDGTHPTDFGFESMAQAIDVVLAKILK